jgi:copper(I)-binding protein
MKRNYSLPLIFLLSIFLLSACVPSGPQLTIDDAWIRPDPLWENAAGYFTVFNDGNESDTLLGVSISISASESLHQTVMEGDVHKMLPVERLEIAPGESISFQPMSYHIMLIDLNAGLDYGQTASLIFNFEKSGQIEVQAEIRPE